MIGSAGLLAAAPVDRQQRRGLGQPVDLAELPAELGLDPLDRLRRRRCPGADDPVGSVRAGDRPGPVRRGVEHGVEHRGRRAHERHAVLLDPPEDLGAVDLAKHDLRHAEPRGRERHAPAVRVEHRQRVQVGVPVADAGMQAEGHRVDPDVAVGDLHALGSRRRAAGVVDRRGRVLVDVGSTAPAHGRTGAGPRRSARRAGTGASRVTLARRCIDLGVDQEDRGAGVVDDVFDLLVAQPEVDRHQDPTRRRYGVEQLEHPRRVRGDDGHPLAQVDAELVEAGLQRPHPAGQSRRTSPRRGSPRRPARRRRRPGRRRPARPGPGSRHSVSGTFMGLDATPPALLGSDRCDHLAKYRVDRQPALPC